ncbi:Gfo/Idh/MocA family protein [Maridesulfovibrio hydrothermalis]|uniref:Oxidoreductase domain protein n=1 Tax=Maridesulfovibrio hydrothermalis AM13 = DSM 14728 TaxID=1121451 RepID=L0R8X0_9BACT|nr:Gfo/Idh/MocA family oxidoreductase [Maridesulfovibrio hydrothermalis]CCO23204.1 Oxidoreductase domain protein [Maridesulfovibrio hydrothermalis AM13 = DSM 14728]
MKVAVIGTGSMGQNHVRLYSDIPGCELVGIADQNTEQTTRLCDLYGGRAYSDYRELIDKEKPEAVTIALPTFMHCQVTLDCLNAGIHVLCEKPIAKTVEEAQEMIDEAKRVNKVLQVGHIERFNPAIQQLKERIADGQIGRIFTIHSRRQSPYPGRITDVGVASDLATHELDMMRNISQSEVTTMTAEVSKVMNTDNEDIVFGLLRFNNGILGILDVNWVTPTKIRKVSVTGENGMFTVDYLNQSLSFNSNYAAEQNETKSEWFTTKFGIAEGDFTSFRVVKKEPLRVEIEAFIQCCIDNETPLVTGEDGLEALSLALKIVECGNNCKCKR